MPLYDSAELEIYHIRILPTLREWRVESTKKQPPEGNTHGGFMFI
jgi:hypothetical protein